MNNLNIGTDLSLQQNLVSGSGPYHNPNDIYSPGHKMYTDYIYGEKSAPDISGIVTNINLLKEGSVLKVMHPEDTIRIFDPVLLADYVLPEDCSGMSVNLRFSSYNIITTTNEFKNF